MCRFVSVTMAIRLNRVELKHALVSARRVKWNLSIKSASKTIVLAESYQNSLTLSAIPMAVPMRSLGTAGTWCMALVKRVAVPPARADGGLVDIGRADDRFLWNKYNFFISRRIFFIVNFSLSSNTKIIILKNRNAFRNRNKPCWSGRSAERVRGWSTANVTTSRDWTTSRLLSTIHINILICSTAKETLYGKMNF